ncbi:MAG: phenylalanine--tRNA ligase subunit beta, partial [Patescibacteria group bacterium]|nr:phenylalanine--tRNA ligase subunit beta [Patescibacteria group bacterium]
LNAIIDITNYVMLEVGHPTHAFDYDKLKTKNIIFRKSKKGERITTLDGKIHTLLGGDIVIDDGTGEIIDLPGIMGAKNSAISDHTETIVFFINNNDEVQIRKTSMSLSIRTVAATLNEKGVDPELAYKALLRGIELYQKIAKARITSEIFDHYPNPYKPKKLNVTKEFIDQRIGIEIQSEKISKVLQSLGFGIKLEKNNLEITIPSSRARDIEIAEDIVEEIARIYGYHNIPSILPTGAIPEDIDSPLFKFEKRIREILSRLGGYEVYTSSLVDQSMVNSANALKLKNPLGEEGQYLRTSLIPSLIEATDQNKAVSHEYFLYEIANVYHPKKKGLPDEILKLGIIFVNYEYRKAKGILEAFFQKLNIKFSFKFIDNNKLEIEVENEIAGEIIIDLKKKLISCEFDISILRNHFKMYTSYKPTSKYPAQTEDYTFEIPKNVKVGDLINKMYKISKLIKDIKLKDIYKDNYTFTVTYHDKTKTLTDKQVAKIRNILLSKLQKAFGVNQK